jgi:putative transposase
MDKRAHSDYYGGRSPDSERTGGDPKGKPSVKIGNRNSKKGYGHIHEKVKETELHEFIEEHKCQYPIERMCEVLAVPRSSYYGALKKTVSKRDLENQELTEEIQRIYRESKGRYGAPKVHQTLLTNGFQSSLKRVQRLMRKAGIRSIVKSKYRPFPSKEKIVQLDNLLKRDFSTHTINEK